MATLVATVACQDADPSSPVPSSEGAFGAVQLRSPVGYQDLRLANASHLEEYSDVLKLIDPGQCLIEHVRGNGTVFRYVRTLSAASAQETDPFGVEYKLKGGRVPYRATCDVPPEVREVAMDAISWAPGNGTHAAGKGWRGQAEGSSEAEQPPEHLGDPNSVGVGVGILESRADLPVSRSVDLDPYSNYDWCYVLLQGSEIVDVLYCGYDADPESCGELEPDGFSGECVDPNGGSGGGGSGGDPETPEVPDSIADPEDLWPSDILPCNLDADPGCEHRYSADQTAAERQRILDAINTILANSNDTCQTIGDTLMAWRARDKIVLYDVRAMRPPADSPLLGRYEYRELVAGFQDVLVWTQYNAPTDHT